MPDDVQVQERPQRQEIIPAPVSGGEQKKRPELLAGAPVAPIVPRTIEEVARVAKAVIVAGLAPNSYEGRNQEETISKIMIGILKGAEVGMPPITALSNIAIINGRPTIWGDGAVALAQAHGLIERSEITYEGGAEKDGGDPTIKDFADDYACVCKIWRRGQGEPYVGRFSVRDAKRAHLWNNPKRDPWMKYPKRMLLARARAFALRDGFADALAGLSIREEIEDLPQEAPRKTDVGFLDDAPASPALPAPSEEPMRQVIPEARDAEPAPLSAAAPELVDAKRSPAPPSPLKFPKKADWPPYVDWLIGEIETMPQAEIGSFMLDHKELDFIAENRKADWARIQAALDARRSVN